MANVTVTQVENVITANSTTNVIEVTQQETNVVISSRTVSDINLANLTQEINSNSNITTTANITGAYLHGDGSNISGLTTSIVTEGTRLYYTQARFDSAFGAKSTTDLTEGTNLYYTQTRFDSAFSAKDTGDLTEGSNLYYTTDRANTAIGAYTGSLTNLTGDVTTTADITAENLVATNNISATANISADVFKGSNVDVSNVVALNDIVAFGHANISLDISGNNLNITNNIDSGGHFTAGSGNITNNLTVGSLTVQNDANITFQDLDINGNLEVFGQTTLRQELEILGSNINLGTPAGGIGNSYVYIEALDGADYPLIEWANASHGANSEFGSWTIGKGRLNLDPTNDGGFTWYEGNNTLQASNLSLTGSMDGLLVDGNAVITGNLQVQGNVDYVNVEDLLVKDTSITLAVGAPTATSANIYVDRSGTGGGFNAYIKWNEGIDRWEFFDGANLKPMPRTTDELAEGSSNLYYTETRFNNSFAGKTTDDLLEGSTNEYFTEGRARDSVSASGDLSYNASTGVFSVTTYKTADFNTDFATKTTSDLTEGTNLYFTTDRANSAIDDYVTGSDNIDVTSGVISLNNSLVNVNSVASETGTVLTAYGQSGIELDQLVDSTQSKIIDINTDGYSIAEATLPVDFLQGTNIPSIIVSVSLTAGSANGFGVDLYSGALGALGDAAALRGPGFSSTLGDGDVILTTDLGTSLANVEAAMTTTGITSAFLGNPPQTGLANVSAGLYGQKYGWTVLEVATGSTTTLFPANTYVTDVNTSTITFSEPALQTGVKTMILIPGMASSTQANSLLKYRANGGEGANAEVVGTQLYGKLQTYEYPETLSNVTFDKISYGNVSSVTMDSVGMKNISDFEGSDESATRFKRALLIGPSTNPDTASAKSSVSNPSTLGVILEGDGETFTGNSAPAPRFLINNYSGALDDLTVYPTWAIVGQTGNLAKDLQQVKAPSLTLKSFRGTKSDTDPANALLQSGDVVGKIEFRPATTTNTFLQGVDYYNPPAAITVDVGDANIGNVANTYMHITTTPDPGTNLGYMRNNTNDSAGANQQTNFTTKAGNVTIAAQTNGMISLAPTPDYGDASNATVWTRYPGTTHEYHRFMDVGFGDKTNKSGTTLEIQPASGTTTGSGGLGYDSVGNATLRFSVHESNSSLKRSWDIFADQSSGNLHIADNTTGTPDTFMHLNGGRVFVDKSFKLQNLTTTEINAIASPEAGDVVYNTTLNQVCFYNGTAWQKITSATM